MDKYYLIQVCSLLCWNTIKMHIPHPPVTANANPSSQHLWLRSPHHGCSPEAALRVSHQFGPDGASLPHPILLPNPNHSIKIDWAGPSLTHAAIGKELGPVDNSIKYGIFVGDLASNVTNIGLMNVFRNPNLGLPGDFPSRLITPLPFMLQCKGHG
jgi:hypothetical protein